MANRTEKKEKSDRGGKNENKKWTLVLSSLVRAFLITWEDNITEMGCTSVSISPLKKMGHLSGH